jgi:hypothetical protein
VRRSGDAAPLAAGADRDRGPRGPGDLAHRRAPPTGRGRPRRGHAGARGGARPRLRPRRRRRGGRGDEGRLHPRGIESSTRRQRRERDAAGPAGDAGPRRLRNPAARAPRLDGRPDRRLRAAGGIRPFDPAGGCDGRSGPPGDAGGPPRVSPLCAWPRGRGDHGDRPERGERRRLATQLRRRPRHPPAGRPDSRMAAPATDRDRRARPLATCPGRGDRGDRLRDPRDGAVDRPRLRRSLGHQPRGQRPCAARGGAGDVAGDGLGCARSGPGPAAGAAERPRRPPPRLHRPGRRLVRPSVLGRPPPPDRRLDDARHLRGDGRRDRVRRPAGPRPPPRHRPSELRHPDRGRPDRRYRWVRTTARGGGSERTTAGQAPPSDRGTRRDRGARRGGLRLRALRFRRPDRSGARSADPGSRHRPGRRDPLAAAECARGARRWRAAGGRTRGEAARGGRRSARGGDRHPRPVRPRRRDRRSDRAAADRAPRLRPPRPRLPGRRPRRRRASRTSRRRYDPALRPAAPRSPLAARRAPRR